MGHFDPVGIFAARCIDRLLLKTGGYLPDLDDEEEWKLLCRIEEVWADRQPRQHCPPNFQAHRIFHEVADSWLILYNMDVPAKTRCEYICHELIEYLAEAEYRQLFQHDPTWLFRIPDCTCDSNFFHLVAERATEMIFKEDAPTLHLATTGDELLRQTALKRLRALQHTMRSGRRALVGRDLLHKQPPPHQLAAVYHHPVRLSWRNETGYCSCGCQDGLIDREGLES
jgi:hypothetical protein